MKKIFLKLFVIFSFALFSLPYSYSSASETIKGAQKDMDAFKKDMSDKLDQVEKELKELREKTKSKGSMVQQNVIQDLEKSRDQLRSELNNIEGKSKDKWKQMKKSLSETFDSLHSKVQEALKSEP